MLPMHRLLENVDGPNPFDQRFKQRPEYETGVGRPQAEMGSKAEGDVGIGFALEPDLPGLLKDPFVQVGRRPAEGDPAPRGHGAGLPLDVPETFLAGGVPG